MSPLAKVWRWIADHLVLLLGLLVLVYMFVPIAVVVLMSFNDPGKSKNVYEFKGFTWNNWAHMC
ncbi:MAG TPA: ABC transporter permease, partial [Nocardioides sp.]|nr:ABC transporter permease [Nocardioides sp.]